MNQNICLNKKSLSSDLRQYYEFERNSFYDITDSRKGISHLGN